MANNMMNDATMMILDNMEAAELGETKKRPGADRHARRERETNKKITARRERADEMGFELKERGYYAGHARMTNDSTFRAWNQTCKRAAEDKLATYDMKLQLNNMDEPIKYDEQPNVENELMQAIDELNAIRREIGRLNAERAYMELRLNVAQLKVDELYEAYLLA